MQEIEITCIYVNNLTLIKQLCSCLFAVQPESWKFKLEGRYTPRYILGIGIYLGIYLLCHKIWCSYNNEY